MDFSSEPDVYFVYPKMNRAEFDEMDPDRHLKRIEAAFGVATRIKKMKKKGQVMKQETQEEKVAKILVRFKTAFADSFCLTSFDFQKSAKEDRSARSLQISLNERYVIDVAAHHFGIDEDTILECAIDSAENTAHLRDLFARDGTFMVLLQFQPDDPPDLSLFSLFLQCHFG